MRKYRKVQETKRITRRKQDNQRRKEEKEKQAILNRKIDIKTYFSRTNAGREQEIDDENASESEEMMMMHPKKDDDEMRRTNGRDDEIDPGDHDEMMMRKIPGKCDDSVIGKEIDDENDPGENDGMMMSRTTEKDAEKGEGVSQESTPRVRKMIQRYEPNKQDQSLEPGVVGVEGDKEEPRRDGLKLMMQRRSSMRKEREEDVRGKGKRK